MSRRRSPDSIIDRAEVEVIDLIPEDLIRRRCARGAIYQPEQGRPRPQFTISLRQAHGLARADPAPCRTARRRADAGPYARPGRRGAVGNERQHPGFASTAARLRARASVTRGVSPIVSGAPWTAIHVETPGSRQLSAPERERIADNFRLASRLGADTVTLSQQNVAQAVLDHARANNFTHVITARHGPSRWQRWRAGSVVEQLIRDAGDISIHVAGDDRPAFAATPAPAKGKRDAPGGHDGKLCGQRPHNPGRSRFRAAASADAGLDQHCPRLHRAVFASAIAYGLAPSLFASCLRGPALQFLLPAADLHLHPGRSRKPSSASFSSSSRR